VTELHSRFPADADQVDAPSKDEHGVSSDAMPPAPGAAASIDPEFLLPLAVTPEWLSTRLPETDASERRRHARHRREDDVADGLSQAAPVAPVQVAGPTMPLTLAVASPALAAEPVAVPPAVVPTTVPVPAVSVVSPTPAAAPLTPAIPASVPAIAVAPIVPAVTADADQVRRDHEASDGSPANKIALDDLLQHMLDVGGSDLHLTAGAPPTVRVRGDIVAIDGGDKLTPSQLRDMLYGVMTERQRKTYEENLELDFAYAIPGRARFRVNIFQQRGSLGAVMRVIPWEIKPLDALGMPPVVETFASLKRGLVLVTGPTGSGKSTTLAAVIDKVNRTRSGHIMTIEDPIEFLHKHRNCLVNQREVGEDTHSFRTALKHVLRQDPDVVLVGELRDLETISVALTAAETGHLVFATLHTQSAQDTITRIVDVFPAEQQQQIRTQLAATLQGVVCQTLCPTVDGKGRVAAVEVMICNPGIRAMIRQGKLQQIQGALQAGAKDGMQTLNSHLADLARANRISYAVGLENCTNRDDFVTLVGPGVRRPPLPPMQGSMSAAHNGSI
jgi:twitching motility protein PilT